VVHHAYLSRLDYGAAWREIAQSKQHCEALLGHEVHHFAYPYGDSSAFGEREIEDLPAPRLRQRVGNDRVRYDTALRSGAVAVAAASDL